MANTYLTRTSGSPTNALKWTYSFWVKTAGAFPEDTFLLDFNTDGNNRSNIGFFATNGEFQVYEKVSGSTSQLVRTSRVFRDPNAWYHIVASCDRTLSTAADRTKIYVNGVRETSFASETQPTQNVTGIINTAVNTLIGKYSDGSLYFSGSLSHVHFVDGTAYDASAFGSTDSTTGEWKINTSPSITMGNNGFTILKDGNTITDQSANSNNFTLGGGTLTNTKDCPSNIFATWNSLKKLTVTLSNGNTTTSGNGDNGVWSTIGNNSGKWYWETQQNANSVMMGIIHEDVTQTTGRSQNAGVYGLQSGNGSYAYYRNNGSSGNSSGFPEITNSNVLCHALDLDNGKYFLGINGVFKNLSGTTSNLGTGADPTFTGLDTTKFWFPFTESRGTGVGCDANFGNGFFGTTAISSEGTNASGIGKFEYDVPAGYTALSTKGLNE